MTFLSPSPLRACLAALTVLAAPSVFAAELLMVAQPGCHYCEQWDAEIGPIYPKTEAGEAVPLRREMIRDLPADVAFASPPIFTPTFVLVEDGAEVGRIEGYSGEEFFWFRLERMFAEAGVVVPEAE